ncbi:MAG: ABC transporter permease [Propionibacteriaceae bacterium]|nr:ABC transporter permease [Propionibacteriaceae bacterium]
MRRHWSLYVGAGLVGLVLLLAAVSLFWTPFDPTHVDPEARLLGPSWPHLLGTDGLGQDIFSRALVGARVCIQVGVIAVAIGSVIGVPLGMAAAASRSWPGQLIMRAADIVYAFPALLLAILLAAAKGGGSILTAMTAIGIASVPAFARIARGAALQVLSQDYVLAARASGIGPVRIAVSHVAPNIAPVVLVQASVSFGLAILAEAALSYLGLSAPPATPTWGRMLYEAQQYIFSNPNLALWPGLFIAVAVLGFNLLGDGLRDRFDPTLVEVR